MHQRAHISREGTPGVRTGATARARSNVRTTSATARVHPPVEDRADARAVDRTPGGPPHGAAAPVLDQDGEVEARGEPVDRRLDVVVPVGLGRRLDRGPHGP